MWTLTFVFPVTMEMLGLEEDVFFLSVYHRASYFLLSIIATGLDGIHLKPVLAWPDLTCL